MKVFELALMLAGAAALFVQPEGGWLAMGVLFLLGVQTALFVPAKYGILPEILPHEDVSAGNGLLEMISNLAMLAGLVGGGVILDQVGNRTFLGGPAPRGAFCARPAWLPSGFPGCKPARAEGGLAPPSASPGNRSGPTACSRWPSSDRSSSGRSPRWCRRRSWPTTRPSWDLRELASRPSAGRAGIGVGVGCLLAGKLSGPRWNTACCPWAPSA